MLDDNLGQLINLNSGKIKLANRIKLGWFRAGNIFTSN
jgi:hypothetical protein